jgi:mono/diheme cytochrome c family protein
MSPFMAPLETIRDVRDTRGQELIIDPETGGRGRPSSYRFPKVGLGWGLPFAANYDEIEVGPLPGSRTANHKGLQTMKRAGLLLFILSIALLDSSVIEAADIDHGRQLARRWCVSCHLVAGNQCQTTTEAPPFATVARKPDFNVNRLASFLLNPYPRMPNMSLTRPEAADIAAYIGSLRK